MVLQELVGVWRGERVRDIGWMYAWVYVQCVKGNEEEVYDELGRELSRRLGSHCEGGIVELWNEFVEVKKVLVCVFGYLDRSLALMGTRAPLSSYFDCIFAETVLPRKIQQLGLCLESALDVFRTHKHDSAENKGILEELGKCIKIVRHLDHLFSERIEKQFLQISKRFYSTFGTLLSPWTVAGFIGKSRALLVQEMQILSLLQFSSPIPQQCLYEFRKGLFHALEQSIENQMEWITFLGTPQHSQYLQTLLRLFGPHQPSVSKLASIFEASVTHQCEKVGTLQLDGLVECARGAWLFRLVECCKQMQVLSKAMDHPLFSHAFQLGLQKAMRSSIVSGHSVAVILAQCLDTLLRKKSRRLSQFNGEDLSDSQWNAVFVIVKNAPDEDMFIQRYQRLLSQRLLRGLCRSESLERFVISRLSKVLEMNLYRWNAMIADVVLSRTVQRHFMKEMEMKTNVEIKSITRGVWPDVDAVNTTFTPPPEIVHVLQKWESYYNARNPRKKLQWAYMEGLVHLNDSRGYSILLSPLQASILMFLHKTEKPITVTHFSNHLHCDPRLIKKALDPLVFGKFKLVLRNSDRFNLNKEFYSESRTILIPFPDFSRVFNRRASIDLSAIIKAFIVRLMKRQRKLDEESILNQCVLGLERFAVDRSGIMECLDNLVETEYLERIEGSPMYQYIP